MGNALRCFKGEEAHQGFHYPYYQPQYYSHDPPAAAPRPHQQAIGAHGVTPATVGAAALTQAAGSNNRHNLHWTPAGPGVLAFRVVASQEQSSTEDIDESSAEGLCNAKSYIKGNAMLIQVQVLGTTRRFWRLSDKATRISRKLALILRSQHSVGKCLAAPLKVSNVWIGSAGSVKLREVSFSGKGFSIERVRDDYKQLSRILQAMIKISGGDITKLPPDYREFLMLLGSDNLTLKDEFLIVNNAALLPMKNRTEVFLMLYDKIVKYLGRTDKAKKRRILSRLPYENDWLDTARANAQINQWVVNAQNGYKGTQSDLLRLNRNVRSHLLEYNDVNVEQILYCEWPELLMAMVKQLHLEGELEATEIQNKFG